jgi:protein required for attachment to host cells
MTTERTWVVVAESSRARIFSLNGLQTPMDELADMVNPEARARDRELVSDRQGRTFDSSGQGRHAKEPATTPKEQRAIEFARQVAERIENGRSTEEFQHLILIAAPAFLGLLRKNLKDPTHQRIKREIQKNIVRESEASIREQIKL